MIDEIQSDRIHLFLEFSDPGDGCIQVLQIQMDDSRTDPPTLQTDRLGTENSHSSDTRLAYHRNRRRTLEILVVQYLVLTRHTVVFADSDASTESERD